MVKVLYYFCMKSKKDKINQVYSLAHSIFYLRAKLEEKPICFAEGVVLTPREIHTIASIGDHQNINVKEVGDYFGVTKSAASQMINKLVKKGFVKKVNPPDNNKEYQLTLTKNGLEAYRIHENFHKFHETEMKDKLGEFSKDEISATAKILKTIEDTVKKRLIEL